MKAVFTPDPESGQLDIHISSTLKGGGKKRIKEFIEAQRDFVDRKLIQEHLGGLRVNLHRLVAAVTVELPSVPDEVRGLLHKDRIDDDVVVTKARGPFQIEYSQNAIRVDGPLERGLGKYMMMELSRSLLT